MERRSALVLLAVFGTGVFLAGLELMITAVALPSILASLVDAAGSSAWIELRKASWIINGYLLVYILTMPMAGRLTDLWGARRLLMGALVVFIVGSALAGMAQSLDQLIAARLVQAVGGGVLVPVGTAAASHLFGGDARPRALGFIGALTFLGMAAGPFLGAAILSSVHPEDALVSAGLANSPVADILAPSWRWIFYVNIPIAIIALVVAWAAAPGWDTPRRAGRVDLLGAFLFGVALLAGLVGLTLIGTTEIAGTGLDPQTVTLALLAIAAASTIGFVLVGLRSTDPFIDPRLFRSLPFSAATLVSALTGYAFATAIIGAAVFVDRVLYGGPNEQRLALGALAGATAVGALVSGFLARALGLRLITVVGLALSIGALLSMSTWTPDTAIENVALALGAFGLGFGLTVTPRSTAAVEAAGRRLFGVASAVVTVARMVGMAVGLAILTAYGSTTIDRLSEQVYATPEAYLQFIPAELHGRPLRDPLVVDALEAWASREAARIMVGLFVVAAAVTAVAIPPSLVLGGRTRMLTDDAAAPRAASAGGPVPDGDPDPTPGQDATPNAPAAEPKHLRAGEPVARRRAPGASNEPGTLRVSAIVDGELQETTGPDALTHLPDYLRAPDASVWIDLAGPSTAQVEAVGAALSLHPLIVEDVLEGNQRAKLEMTNGVVHLVLFHLEYEDRVVASELDMVLGLGFLLTVHGSGWDPHMSHHLGGGTEAILTHGPDHLLWALCDDIVDGYFPFSDELGDAIDQVQDEVMLKATPQTLERVFELKRQLIEVRRSISPVREVFNQLTNRDMPLIDENEIVYFRDVYDHLIRLTDELDMYRELASATLDVYLTQVNNNLSVIMKRLTGVTVILAGIGAVAGIFGMSEANAAIGGGEAGGFWAVTAIVAVAAGAGLAFLRKIDWI